MNPQSLLQVGQRRRRGGGVAEEARGAGGWVNGKISARLDDT